MLLYLTLMGLLWASQSKLLKDGEEIKGFDGESWEELDDTNFESKIASYGCSLILFYTPECKFCKKLHPEFEAAAGYLLANEPPVHLVKIDCAEEDEICGNFGVKSYPTLKIFRRGKFLDDYVGPRHVAGIVRYMKGQVEPETRKALNKVQKTTKTKKTSKKDAKKKTKTIASKAAPKAKGTTISAKKAPKKKVAKGGKKK